MISHSLSGFDEIWIYKWSIYKFPLSRIFIGDMQMKKRKHKEEEKRKEIETEKAKE